jgi:hypothetical protein
MLNWLPGAQLEADMVVLASAVGLLSMSGLALLGRRVWRRTRAERRRG